MDKVEKRQKLWEKLVYRIPEQERSDFIIGVGFSDSINYKYMEDMLDELVERYADIECEDVNKSLDCFIRKMCYYGDKKTRAIIESQESI